MPRMSFQNLKRFFNCNNQGVFQIGAQIVLPKSIHFRIIELAKFSVVDNTCDVTWLTTKRNKTVLKYDVSKIKIVKLWDLSGYSERTTSKTPNCQKLALWRKLSLRY